MSHEWPNISPDIIEQKALEFLVEYHDQMASPVAVPIEVEVIAEHYLGYDIDITNEGLFQDPSFLGGINFEDNVISVNASVEAHDGRYAFTIAHEIGHHVLHKENFCANESPDRPLCREVGKKPVVESQADRFAAALLMPETIIKSTFEALEDTSVPRTAGALKGLASKMILVGGFTNVSVSAMANRLIDCQLVPSSLSYQSGTRRDFKYYKSLNIYNLKAFFRRFMSRFSS